MNRYARVGDRVVIRFCFSISDLVHLVVEAESYDDAGLTACRIPVVCSEDKGDQCPLDKIVRRAPNCLWRAVQARSM